MTEPLALEGETLHDWTLSSGDKISLVSGRYRQLIDTFVTNTEDTALQIGSKSSVLDRNLKWRNYFDGKNFVGSDISAGDNVDVVFDVTGNIGKLRKSTGIKQFDGIICCHVLEHVRNPFLAAANLAKLLKKGGLLFVSVPWVQGYHEFPDDFWRFSFAGLRELFKDLEVFAEAYSGPREEVFYQLRFNGKPEHSERTCRIERNLFQMKFEDIPRQPMFTDFSGDKIQLAKLYMPATVVTTVFRKP